MSVSGRCDELHELMSELALGIADGEQRALVLEHVAVCADCRRELELSIVADEIARAGSRRSALRAPSRCRLYSRGQRESSVGGHASFQPLLRRCLRPPSRRVRRSTRSEMSAASPPHYRATLPQAHGRSFRAVRLRAAGDVPAGTVFVYRGTPSRLLVTVAGAYRSSVEGAQLVLTDRRSLPLAAVRLTGGSWGGAIPVDAATVAGLRLLGRDGRSVLAAYLPRRW
jgi:hypothetical protein